MKKDYTHITVILDRTGSMETIRDDTIGGFNTFLREQQSQPGRATLTLVQFDSKDPYEVIHDFKPIGLIPELTRDVYVPRATTPLLDAMGRGINDLDKVIKDMSNKKRPSRIVMVIITDGQENSSKEFKKAQIEKMIRTKQKKGDWQFVFLSADLGAIGDALQSGIRADSTMAFDKTSAGTKHAFRSISLRIKDYRAGKTDEVALTDEDRNMQEIEKHRP